MKANREIGRWTLAGTIVVLGGCAGTLALGSHPGTSSPPSATRLTLDTSSAPVPGAHADSGATARYGSVAIAVAWPARSQTAGRGVQAIPLSATSIALSLASGSTTVATASITSPATNSTLATIPVGTYTLTAEALRADGSDAASASAPLDVVADRVAGAQLNLVPTSAPSLTSIYPTSGVASINQIDINGVNLAPPANGTYSVYVDNQAVPTSMLQGGSSTIYLMGLPSWAQNDQTASISVSVDGVPAPGTQVFTVKTVACLKLSPTDPLLENSTTLNFTAAVYSDAACSQVVSGIPLYWSLSNENPVPSSSSNAQPPFTLSNGVFETFVSTGSAEVDVTAGGLLATTSVTASVSTAVLDATPTPGHVM